MPLNIYYIFIIVFPVIGKTYFIALWSFLKVWTLYINATYGNVSAVLLSSCSLSIKPLFLPCLLLFPQIIFYLKALPRQGLCTIYCTIPIDSASLHYMQPIFYALYNENIILLSLIPSAAGYIFPCFQDRCDWRHLWDDN